MLRPLVVASVWIAAIAVALLALSTRPGWWVLAAVLAALAAVLAALAALGTWDLLQTRHTILRAYPILGHARFLFEGMRPAVRQYFIESNTEASPFDREDRTLVYRAGQGHRGDDGRSAPSATSTPWATRSFGTRCGARTVDRIPARVRSRRPRLSGFPTTSRCSMSRR